MVRINVKNINSFTLVLKNLVMKFDFFSLSFSSAGCFSFLCKESLVETKCWKLSTRN